MNILDKLKHRKKLKIHGVHFGDDDIILKDTRMNSVYEYPPKTWEKGDVADFYCDSGSDIYFLKVICSIHEALNINNDLKLMYYSISTEIDIKSTEGLEEENNILKQKVVLDKENL